MKKKLSILAFGLLLAVGWTNVASAQLLPEFSTKLKTRTMSMNNSADKQELQNDFRSNPQAEMTEVVDFTSFISGANRAPKRATYNQTADATHVRAWYDAKTYTWSDGTGTYTAKYTDPVNNPYQMAYLVGKTYINPEMPGIKYTEVYDADHPYMNIGLGYDIPSNSRWSLEGAGTNYSNMVINLPTADMTLRSITVYNANNTVLTSWDAATAYSNGQTGTYYNNGSYRTYYTLPGWSYDYYLTVYKPADVYYGYIPGGGNITIPSSLLNGTPNITVVIEAYSDTDGETLSVNGVGKNMTTTLDTYTWTFEGSAGSSSTVTPPYENGYTTFLVKVKDWDLSTNAPQYVTTWNNLINYFNTYIDEIQLLTDGMRVQEGTADAGTVFTYSGILNRFFFISKGKMAYLQSTSTSQSYDRAPFYSMYEEFSPTTTAAGDEITDFYSRMLEGESYDIVHDCQSVNYMQHFFSMSGKAGTEAKSLTNLIFYIPDNRGQASERNYEPEHQPQVGLYNITLAANAVPVDDYSPDNRYYNVTCDWQSSLSRILDFDVDQTYQLWIFVYDEQGNPVPVPETEGGLLYTGPNTTYTYTVPQYPDSYTIVYRVKGWPTDATNNPVNDPDGTFFAWSNLDDVLIPGYQNFLSLGLDHYESDFKVDEELNYYRNFLTVSNENPFNELTPQRVIDGENLFKLYRFADGNKNSKVKAAELSFYQQSDEIWYNIDYFGQNNLPGYDLQTLNIPTTGPIAKLSNANYVKVASAADLTDGQYLIVYEDGNVALDGSLTSFNNAGNTIPVRFKEDGTISANRATNASAFTINVTNGTILSKSGYYIYQNANDNGMSASQNVPSNTQTITIDSDGNAVIACQGTQNTRYIRYNPTWGGFRYYLSGAQKSVQLYKLVSNRDEEPTRAYTLLNGDLNAANYLTGYVYPAAPWSVDGTQLRKQDSGYFYILDGTGLNFTMPSGYNGANLKFVVHIPNSTDYYRGSFNFITEDGTYSMTTAAMNRDYECTITGVNSGDVINIHGTCYVGSTGTTLYNYSPDFTTLYVYVEGGQDGQGYDDPLYLADIMFVDQFNASTKNDTHPYRYGYFLQYDPEDGGDPETSSVQEVPVQHTGATLGGYYTLQQIQDDEYATLDTLVMNANVNMNLANNPAIYFYTLERKPNNDATAAWDEISRLQIRTDGTYQEIDEKLTQYIEQICEPGIVPRYDNETYSVLYGNYNDYMSYVPVVWTHGELVSNRRIKWESEHLHNSYGAPIWKTGVGDAKVLSADSWRQQGKYGSTNWADENGDSCSLYFLEVTAKGFMPTNNTVGNENGFVPYVPYWFNVYAVSESGQLRGYSQVGTPGVDPDTTGSAGSHLVNNPEKNRYIWRVYGGRTTDGYLEKHLSSTWADNFAFGALNNISDLQIIVRFYYVVNGMIQSTDYVMDRDGAPAGYGAESPGFSPEPHTGIIEVLNPNHGNVVKTTYVNPQGLQSDKPFDGVNIVINRYEDGTTSTSKVIR